MKRWGSLVIAISITQTNTIGSNCTWHMLSTNISLEMNVDSFLGFTAVGVVVGRMYELRLTAVFHLPRPLHSQQLSSVDVSFNGDHKAWLFSKLQLQWALKNTFWSCHCWPFLNHINVYLLPFKVKSHTFNFGWHSFSGLVFIFPSSLVSTVMFLIFSSLVSSFSQRSHWVSAWFSLSENVLLFSSLLFFLHILSGITSSSP